MKKILTLILFTFIASLSYGQFDRDTLTSWTDSISVFNVPRYTVDIYETIEVSIKDASGGTVDSFVVEKYDPYNAEWHAIGAKNMKSWGNEYTLVPGTGVTQSWIILSFCEKANYIRVRRTNVVGGAGIKSMVTWEGKGKCQ